MRIRRIMTVGLGIGAVALALAGCTRTAQGLGGGQGYHGARYTQTLDNQGRYARGLGRGSSSTDDVARGVPRDGVGSARGASGALRGTAEPGRGVSSGRGAVEPVRGSGISRGTGEPASDRTGRDVAAVGTSRTLSGKLASEGIEWYLKAAEGRYLLHLGNASFVEQTGVRLEDGKSVAVKGLVDADEVSVISLEVDGKTYAFRSEDGRPLWAGGGRGAGRSAGQGSGWGTDSGA